MNLLKKQDVILALGGNLPSKAGSPEATIRAAIEDIAKAVGNVRAVSAFYQTRAVTLDGQADVPDFTNAAVMVETALGADAILAAAKTIEQAYGRTPGARWSARTLDIDLIAMGDHVLPDAETWFSLANSADPAAFVEAPMVPHPRAHVRGFVLAPLLDVAPGWVHPLLNQSVSDLFTELDSKAGFADIRKIS